MAAEKRDKLGADTAVSVAELAALLDLSADRIYQLIRDGTLQTVKRGRLLLADSIQRYIKYRLADAVDEEDLQIERLVRLTGLTKQDYIIRKLQNQDVVVQGNPRVYKALKNEFAKVLTELQRIEAGSNVDSELLDIICLIADILNGMKEETI